LASVLPLTAESGNGGQKLERLDGFSKLQAVSEEWKAGQEDHTLPQGRGSQGILAVLYVVTAVFRWVAEMSLLITW